MTSASPAGRLNGFHEAAILLRAMGEDQAARSVRRLWPADAQRLGGVTAALGRVTANQIDGVLGAFLEAAGSFGDRGAAAAEYLKSLVEGSRRPDASRRVRDRLRRRWRPMIGLRWVSAAALARLLHRQNQAISGITLAYLEPARAAGVLAALPAAERGNVMLQLIAGTGPAGPGCGAAAETLGGIQAACAVLHHLGPDVRAAVLAAVRVRAPELANRLEA